MNNIAKESLRRICEYLSKSNITLSHKSRDGRVNSAEDEDILMPYIEKIVNEDEFFNNNGLKFKYPGARYWYDFALESETEFIPVNIKTSDLSKRTADNLNSKESIAYALTGIRPEEQKITTWPKFNKVIEENINSCLDTDYYYLVVNKADTSDVFFNSLKCIEKLVPNGNNLPFQCNWAENKNIVENRSIEDSVNYILYMYDKSLERKEQAAVSGRLATKAAMEKIRKNK